MARDGTLWDDSGVVEVRMENMWHRQPVCISFERLSGRLLRGIPIHEIKGLKLFFYTNPASSKSARDKIEINHAEKVAPWQIIEPSSKEEVFRHVGFLKKSHPGAIQNSNRSFCPINKLSYPWDNLTFLLSTICLGKNISKQHGIPSRLSPSCSQSVAECLIQSSDWENAYRKIPWHQSQWTYLDILNFNGSVYIDLKASFGGVSGCASFGGPTARWRDIMQQKFNLKMSFGWVEFCSYQISCNLFPLLTVTSLSIGKIGTSPTPTSCPSPTTLNVTIRGLFLVGQGRLFAFFFIMI